MKLWWPLLAVLPAGLLLGMVGGRMVDSSRPRVRDSPEGTAEAARPALAPAYPPAGAPPMARDGQAMQPSEERPDLDWDAQYRPADRGSGAYAYDEDYFGQSEGDFGDDWPGQQANSNAPANSLASAPAVRPGEAIAAARAAERAAGDASRAAGVAAQAATPPRPAARPAEMPIATTAREPRSADGDLPAIW